MSKALFFLFLTILITSCADYRENNGKEIKKKPYVHEQAEWNYIIYMAADNNLERFAIKNLYEIKDRISGDAVNVVVLCDRAAGYDKTEDDWTTTRILELSSRSSLSDDCLLDLGELDTTATGTLSDFLDFCESYYPAKRMILNIWGHGFGMYPDCKIALKARSLISDYATGYTNHDAMDIKEFCSVLESYTKKNNKKIDILQFDCCYMQMFEIFYELSDFVNYVVGSECELPGDGSNYSDFISDICSNANSETEYFAKNLVDHFEKKYKETLISCSYSAVNLQEFSDCKNLYNRWIDLLVSCNDEIFYQIKNIIQNHFVYGNTYVEFLDLYDLLTRISENCRHNEIVSATGELKEFFDRYIISCFSNLSYENNLHGIGINLPYTSALYDYYKISAVDQPLKIYKESFTGNFINRLCFGE